MLKHLNSAALVILVSLGMTSPALAVDGPAASAEAHASSKTAYRWPKEAPSPLFVAMKWKKSPEDPAHQIFHISGKDISIDMESIAPFVMDEMAQGNPDWPGSVVFPDSRTRSGMLCFTLYPQGRFMPSADKTAVNGYAAALLAETDEKNGVKVELVTPPSDLNRKVVLMRSKPVFLTWKLSSKAGADFERTDYFFDLGESGILIVSTIGQPDEEPSVRKAAEELLRFADIEIAGQRSTK